MARLAGAVADERVHKKTIHDGVNMTGTFASASPPLRAQDLVVAESMIIGFSNAFSCEQMVATLSMVTYHRESGDCF